MRTHGLTEQQADFVREYSANGGKGTAAAIKADYYAPATAAWRLLLLPHIREAIRAERERTIECGGACAALAVMRDLLTADYAGQVRFQSRQVDIGGLAGHGIAAQTATAPTSCVGELSEMTADELELFIVKGEARIAAQWVVAGFSEE